MSADELTVDHAMNAGALLVIITLILVNALYVAAEFAAVGVRRGQVRQLAEGGNRLATGLLPILEDSHRLDRYIACCQIGITFSSLVLGAFGQATLALDLAAWLGTLGWQGVAAISTAATAVLVTLTIFQVVFGELVPKSIALQYPTPTALMTYVPMVWSLALFRWFIAVLNGSGLLLVKLLGFPHGAHRHVHSPEEIDMLIVESADGGLLERDEQRRLHEALRLGRRTARELMTPRHRIQTLDADAPFEEMLRRAISSRHTRVPVYRGSTDNVIGFVHMRDLAVRLAEKAGPASLADVLRPIPSVPDTITVQRLLPQLRRRGQRMALVIDEFGTIEGIITLQDVLDELLGTPVDDFGPEHPAPETLPDGRIRLPGLLRISDAADWVGVEWHDDDVITVGGLVSSRLAHLPRVGERVSVDGVELEIERMDRHMVASVLATPPARERQAG